MSPACGYLKQINAHGFFSHVLCDEWWVSVKQRTWSWWQTLNYLKHKESRLPGWGKKFLIFYKEFKDRHRRDSSSTKFINLKRTNCETKLHSHMGGWTGLWNSRYLEGPKTSDITGVYRHRSGHFWKVGLGLDNSSHNWAGEIFALGSKFCRIGCSALRTPVFILLTVHLVWVGQDVIFEGNNNQHKSLQDFLSCQDS
jgi:hypothetical protein